MDDDHVVGHDLSRSVFWLRILHEQFVEQLNLWPDRVDEVEAFQRDLALVAWAVASMKCSSGRLFK